jgi:N-acetyl-anhydromuramyl-L-alanine amidase AmpD
VRLRRGHFTLAAVLAAAAAVSSAAWGAPLRVLIKDSPNKTSTNRTRATINAIVIHDTEGRFRGSIRVLQRAATRGSAHFVVSRRGQIVQLVPVTDVAWHAGNAWWNLHSIGIEHEGWVGRRAYTEQEYRASAQLVAYLAHRWSIPLDREHVIGHDEVPNPFRPGFFGGANGHSDPGRYWNWPHYMTLVRYYAAHPVLPSFVKEMTVLPDAAVPGRATDVASDTAAPSAPARHVARRPTVDHGATLHGKALWWSGVTATTQWRRHIWKVDFLVDGVLRYTDHTWPYSFHRTVGWDSSAVGNGRHMLVVRAYGAHRYRSRRSVPVRVANAPLRVKITGAVSGAAVDGVLALGTHTSAPVERVALYVDGRLTSRDDTRPYRLVWDTRAAGEGAHTLLVYARGVHGTHRAALTVPVVVANAPTFPPALTRNWVTRRSVTDLLRHFGSEG